jgi:hypothetical protein
MNLYWNKDHGYESITAYSFVLLDPCGNRVASPCGVRKSAFFSRRSDIKKFEYNLNELCRLLSTAGSSVVIRGNLLCLRIVWGTTTQLW